MSGMKCPFCQQELETGNYYVHCHNPECNITVEMEGTEELWQALIDTKNKLDNEKQHEKIMAEAIQHNLETEQRLVQECMKAEKKLDIAVDALKELKPQKAKGGGYWAVKSTDAIKLINTALEQITALEQKD